VASIVNDAVDASRPILQAQDQELVLELPDDSIYIEGDPTRLAQVMTNLLNNAAKFSDAGSQIRVEVMERGGQVSLSVEDHGLGIPAHLLDRIFDMFVQADTSLQKSRSGLGVGLTIAKKLTELHGGTIEAHSDGLGMGSRFTVRLPAVFHVASSEPSRPPKQDRKPHGRRILIADDNRDAAITLALLLKLQGHETQTAYDGLEALDVAQAFRPDIAILDIGMPKLNGYEVCRQLRGSPWGRRMTLVALTGWGQQQDKQRAREAGFDLHLVKPVEPDMLTGLLSGDEKADDSARTSN
jgi:CheY-like chemotaxis protein/anti-sigma regulatory factor (Ser/Thr protein kinase)